MHSFIAWLVLNLESNTLLNKGFSLVVIKIILLGLLSVFLMIENFAQIDSMSNGHLSIHYNSEQTYRFIKVSHIANKDSLVLNNLGLWLYATKGTDTALSIQKANSYNDFSAGPFAQIAVPENFMKAQKVSQQEIKNHAASYKQDNYSPAANILNWPGSFNGSNYGAFVDFNANATYEPKNGDYPLIRGDQSFVKIENDKELLNRNSAKQPLGIEATQYFFLFPNAGDPIMDNTIGFRWVLKNISGQDWDTVLAGVNFHGSVSANNYISTDVTNNGMMIYSKNNTSKQFASVLLLNQKLVSSHYYTNSLGNQNGIPSKDADFMNYLNGKWINGKNLTRGNTGVDGINKASFVFPNTTLSDTVWNEDAEGNLSGDRSGLLVSKFTNWKNGTYQVIEGAFFYAQNIDNFSAMYDKHNSIVNAYKLNRYTGVSAVFENKIEVFPNPAYNAGNIQVTSSVYEIEEVKIIDMSGKIINSLHFNQYNVSIDMSACKKGLYFLSLRLENKTTKIIPITIL